MLTGIIGGNVVEQFIIYGILTGQSYLNLLQNEVVPTLKKLYPNRNGGLNRNIQLQHNGHRLI